MIFGTYTAPYRRNAMKQATLKDFLTEREIRHAMQLKNARDICEQIIKPAIARINRSLGQENDPMYIAYAVEYALLLARESKK
jgi:hypothetical protein